MSMRFGFNPNPVLLPPHAERDVLFHLFSDDGRPAAGIEIDYSLRIKNLVLIEKPSRTGPDGTAGIRIKAGQGQEKGSILVRCGGAEQECTVIVSNTRLTLPEKIVLTDTEELLLKALFWSCNEITVLKEFGGGLSGNRVLQVQTCGDRGLFLTQIVKTGMADEIRGECDRYEAFFRNRMPSAAAISDYIESGRRAAVVYGDAGASSRLQPVRPFDEFFLSASESEMGTALYAVLKKGLSKVHQYYSVRPMSFQRLVQKFLPENLVVSLGGSPEFSMEISPAVSKQSGTGKTLSARDVERKEFPFKTGDGIRLQGLRISKLQPEDLNLEDADRQNYKVKVRLEGAQIPPLKCGDVVDLTAAFVTDRMGRVRNAVSNCLENCGFRREPAGYCLKGECFPDPVPLFSEVLESTCDTAWGTIHGDLHWQNVMMESPSNWWLIDYGLSGEGPILYDFVKLEMYLRNAVLAKHAASLTPRQILEFECGLLEDPFGEFEPDPGMDPLLRKARLSIQAIRRLARPYVIGSWLHYLRLIFVYGMALSKYYPESSSREKAQQKGAPAGEKLKAAERQFFHALAPALAVSRTLVWEKSLHAETRIRCEFVPMGTPLQAKPGAIALDVGSRCEPGVIDHHFGGAEEGCAASLVYRHFDWISSHAGNLSPDQITWMMHEDPDFDCLAALFLAWNRLKFGFFPPGAEGLSRYSLDVDSGAGFLETVPFPERTPYALFQFYLNRTQNHAGTPEQCCSKAMEGFRLIGYFCFLHATGEYPFLKNLMPPDHDYSTGLAGIQKDMEQFEKVDRALGREIEVPVQLNGDKKMVSCLVLESPRSRFYKAWARKQGYTVLVVRWPPAGAPDHRIVVSVPPDKRHALAGLGRALEKAEDKKRRQMNKVRDAVPRRFEDVNNSDPWYDGRSPIHAYTIVDSPHAGTVLTLEEVIKILQKGSWNL